MDAPSTHTLCDSNDILMSKVYLFIILLSIASHKSLQMVLEGLGLIDMYQFPEDDFSLSVAAWSIILSIMGPLLFPNISPQLGGN